MSLTFDAAGQLTGEEGVAGAYRHAYDETGNLAQTTFPDGGEGDEGGLLFVQAEETELYGRIRREKSALSAYETVDPTDTQ